jgi:hypothetical protein
MSKAREIVQKYDDYYVEAYNAWNPYFPLAERDLRYYLGDQWDEKEKQILFEEGRNQFVFNRIRRNINLITGYQRKNRLSSVVVPVENSDQQTADIRTQLLLYSMQNADGYRQISDCFGGALKTGFNLATVWMDYRDDPINGDIRIGREPYNGFITDPYFTQLDFSDCSYVIRRKYIGADQAASLLPGQEKEVFALQKMGWNRDDKFTWLPYQRQPNGQDLIAFNEFFEQKWRNVPMLVDMETGEFTKWEGDKERLGTMLDLYPQLKVVQKPTRYIEQHIILNDEYMRTEINPYGLDEYPFVPFVGIFEPESDLWGLKMQSLIRCMIDPQREANRRRSQMVDILDSQINSGWIADEDSVINPRSLFQASQGKTIWRKRDAKPGALEKIPPAQIPPSMFQLQELFDRDMMEIAGVNDAAFGQATGNDESGVLMMLRQGAAIVNLQDLFDNLRFSQKMLSKKMLKMMQAWNSKKIERITNKPPGSAFYDPESVKYDVSVQEGLLTDTQKQMYFRQLVDLRQMGVPVSGKMLAEAAPIQGKSEFIQQLAQEEQAQAKQAQEAAQMQQQVMQTQSQLSQAKAINDVAMAKERFTRAVANVGLSDERSAKAIDDRASAALGRVKAMKELASMDDDQLVKYLSIIKMMEESNRISEEQIKSDDVALAAKGQEIGDFIAGSAGSGQKIMSSQQNPALEGLISQGQ